MNFRNMTRRELLEASALTAAAGVLAACQPKVVEVEKVVTQVVKETVVVTEEKIVKEAVEVEKEVTRIVEKQAEAAPREPTTIVVMYQRNEFSEAEQAIFEEKYAPYKVEYLDNDLTKLMAMLAAGNPVDFFRIYGVNTPAYVTRRIARDLTDYFETSTKVPVSDLMPVNDIFMYQGRRYGMVKDWSPDFSIFVNKKLFGEAGVAIPSDEEPTPYQTWRELSSKLTKKEGDRILVFGTDFTPHTNVL
ncbi:MAG: extracellular solute-binding protein, partial [Anaerolineae bacterium]|nr:extracellular solute-binding protein [Anaerolineae bacterium]